MNKKSFMGLTLAAVITLSSTSVIAFASQNTEKSTRNVVKVVNNNVSAAKSNVAIQNHDITNDKAIEIAKKALNDYLGVDIEAKIKTDGLKITVDNCKTSMMVVFDKGTNKYGAPEASVEILKQDGKARFVAWRGDRENKEFSYDAAKVKQAAQKYLNEKGLDKNIKSITASDELKEGGVFSAVCEYTDGSSVNLEFNGKDYSPVLYCSIPKPVKVDAKSQNSNITDEKAKQLAGDVFSKYLGVDIDQKIKDEALETRVDRFDDEILISFNESSAKAQKGSNSKMLNGDFSVTISAKDGSMTSVCGIDNLEEKEYPFDEAKIKDAAAKYLKDKGFDTNVQSITADNEKQKIGLVGADCKYADGSTVLLELSAKDYSVVCVSVYGASK